MDFTIHYDHKARGNAERFGSTKERWEEIRKLRTDASHKENIETLSEAIEWVISQLEDVKPCDLVIVGYMFG